MRRVSHFLLLGVFAVGFSFPFVFGQDGKKSSPRTLPLVIEEGTKLQYDVRFESSQGDEKSMSTARKYDLEVKAQTKGRWAVAIAIHEVADKSRGSASEPAETIRLGCTVDERGVVRDIPTATKSIQEIQRTLDFVFGAGLRAKPIVAGESIALGSPGPKAASLSGYLTLRMTPAAKKKTLSFAIFDETNSSPEPAGSKEKTNDPKAKMAKPSGSAVYDLDTGLLRSATIRKSASKGSTSMTTTIRRSK